MRYWWVNQNQTYKHEVPGGFLWSPKTRKDGARNYFYDTMTEVSAGDVVLSFCGTLIKAVGIAQGPAESADKPAAFGAVGDQWDKEGWYVPVEFEEVADPVRPKEFIEDLRPHFFGKYDPLQESGNGNQGVYLAEISEGFLETVLVQMDRTLADVVANETVVDESEEQAAEEALRGRTDIGATKKAQLVQARRGQGVFKSNVRLNEKACRVTGITDPVLLIASHIKPWRSSTDEEKLDGCNGLLLSPHVDRLFDRGLISFENDGTVRKSSRLPKEVLDGWGLGKLENVGPFKAEQCAYLAYHRDHEFKA